MSPYLGLIFLAFLIVNVLCYNDNSDELMQRINRMLDQIRFKEEARKSKIRNLEFMNEEVFRKQVGFSQMRFDERKKLLMV